MKGFIFDYGGTIDTQGCHWGKMIWHAYERAKVPVTEEDFRTAYKYAERTLGTTPIIQPDYTFRQTLDMKLRIELEFIEDNFGVKDAVLTYGTKILDDLYQRTKATTAKSHNVLNQLQQEYPLALVSNFYGNINVVLREFNLDGLFKHVIESAVVGVRKPDPRIFLMGVEALGFEASDVVVVGDSYTKDILPAHSIGCKTVMIEGDPWTTETCDDTVIDYKIDNLNELLTLF